MDVQDVSSLGQFAAMIQAAEVNAALANRRKGETPRDHPPALLLVQRHMMQLQSSSGMSQYNYTVATSQVPAPYPPCTLSAAELKPIFISQMKLETHHRGSKVVVRVMVPPNRITAIMAIVEDEKGTAVLLQLYNQPPEAMVPANETLRQGCFYLLKEPFFKAATSDGSYSLRVDHVSDIMLLNDGDELLPAKWRKTKTITGTSQSIRMQGNEAVGKKNWAEAERLYTSAIDAAKTTEDEQLAYLNRSLVNLRLGRPAMALADAVRGAATSDRQPPEKGLFREASALYQLAKFDLCLERLELLIATYPSSTSNAEARAMMGRVEERIREQQTGQYDFRKMYKQAEATPPMIDCATYSAPVEVRESPGRGRGLFTTRKVAAGELLLCEKAFGYSFVNKDGPGQQRTTILMNLTTKKAVAGGQADLLTQLVQKLYHDPDAARSYTKLYHANYSAVPVAEVDGRPVVDSFLVEKTMSLNVFGAPRTSRASAAVRAGLLDKERETPSAYATSGMWYMVSHINHACISNCRRSFIGDMQIVRAAKDLDEGTELFFWYQVPSEYESYDETQKHFESWGFRCTCALCVDRKSMSETTIAKRKALRKDLQRAMGHDTQTMNASRALQVLRQLEQTYSAAAMKPGAVRLELWDPYFALGQAFLAMKNGYLDAAETTLKGFEALGYIITACPRRGTAKSKPAKLEIEQWGLANDFAVVSFLHLAQAYIELAPALSRRAQSFAETAYVIVVGEKETFLDTYPTLGWKASLEAMQAWAGPRCQ